MGAATAAEGYLANQNLAENVTTSLPQFHDLKLRPARHSSR
jgi:hypothetical protein